MNRDISIERRKYCLFKKIQGIFIKNMFSRLFYLKDNEELLNSAIPLIKEFNYLCELQEGS